MVNWTPEKEKDFFKLKYKDGLTYDDIAEKMAKKYGEEFTKGSLNSRHDAIKRGDDVYYRKLVKEVTGEAVAEEKKEPKAKPEPEAEPEEKPKKKKPKAEGELEPSAYRWKYKEGAYDLQAVEIKATDGESRTFSDTSIFVLVEERAGGVMVPPEATVSVAGEDIRYAVGEKSKKWTEDDKQREVAKINIDFAKNDKTFEGEKFTKIEKATEKGEEVDGVVIELKTEKKTDLFRDDTEELAVIPGEGGHALDWADDVKRITIVKVEDQLVWTIDGKDAIGMRVEGVDTNGQTYVGTIQGLKKEAKDKAIKIREEMKEGREEAAWSEIESVGFAQKRKDGRVEYVYIDPGKTRVGPEGEQLPEPGVTKAVRIPPTMGGK